MKIKIKEVNSSSDINRFIKFQFKHYKGNPYWVPPLIKFEKQTLSARNPLRRHVTMQPILAYEGKKIVGRANVLINKTENDYLGVKHARFDRIEFVNNISVSRALFAYMEAWAKARDMEALKGPFGLTNFDKAGMLFEGFDRLSTMATIYNYDYYPKHLDSLGYQKLVDWHEFLAPVPQETPPKVIRLTQLLKDRYGLQEVPIQSKQDLKKMIPDFFPLVEAAYAEIEGFVPFTDELKAAYAKKFMRFLHPDFAKFIADKDGRLIAFGISMPSFSKALQKAKGRLFPFGIFYIRQAQKKNDLADLYLIGVHPDWQNKGIPALIINSIISGMRKNSIRFAESNPELETNNKLHRLFGKYETQVHKKRRAYIKQLYHIT